MIIGNAGDRAVKVNLERLIEELTDEQLEEEAKTAMLGSGILAACGYRKWKKEQANRREGE